MPQHRHLAWALIAALLATIAVGTSSGVAFGHDPKFDVITSADPNTLCQQGEFPTGWSDELHPPSSIRVLRSKGPDAGHVQTVPFWDYVAVVLRTEYATGQDKPPLWMRVGAITVKQYGWFYAIHWRGEHTDAGECYDLKDTTADQIYKPQETGPDGTVYPGSIPTPANYRAMRETWHITLRKWVVKKSRTRMFLTGYRSGKQLPCGTDSTGFKILQKSLRDCYVKGLTLEETLRRYFEPNLYIVDTRTDDVLSDGGDWYGDLGVLASAANNTTQWRVYAGVNSGFNAPVVSTFAIDPSKIIGQGSGETTAVDINGAADSKLLNDLVMLVDTGGGHRQLMVARANGTAYDDPISQAAPDGVTGLLVADFNGDRLADAGLLGPSGGQTKLSVMLGQGAGVFGAAQDWWIGGPLDLSPTGDVVLAGDTNGDGKADLIVRDQTTDAYVVALSRASCTDFSAWGPCPAGAVGAPGLENLASWLTASVDPNAKNVVGDFNRDGRDDVLAVVPGQSGGVDVVALRSRPDGGFADPLVLWHGSMALSDIMPVALNVNPDGLGDLGMLQKNGATTSVFWLKSIEQSTVPASMTLAGSYTDSSLPWDARNRLY